MITFEKAESAAKPKPLHSAILRVARSTLAVIMLFFASIIAQAQGTTRYTVFPIGFENQNGNWDDSIFSSLPLSRLQMLTSAHVRQVWTTPVMISSISFRMDEDMPDISAVIPGVRLTLGTTSQTIEAFLSFPGSQMRNSQTVLSGSTLNISHVDDPQRLNPFSIRLTFDAPYFYNPDDGNLLLRLSHDRPDFGVYTLIDEHWFPNDDPQAAGALYFDTGTRNRSVIISEIGWTAVPEPATATLLTAAALALLLNRRRTAR